DRLHWTSKLFGSQANLGAHDHARPGAEVAHDLAQVRLRSTITVRSRRIKIGNTGIERPRHRLALLGGIPAHHEPPDCATAEAKCRNSQGCAAQRSLFHGSTPSVRQRAPPLTL